MTRKPDLAADTAAFLAGGGSITQVGNSPALRVQTVTDIDRRSGKPRPRKVWAAGTPTLARHPKPATHRPKPQHPNPEHTA